MRNAKGVSSGEIMVFLVLLGACVMVCVYLNQKPKVIERTVIMQPPPAAPVVTLPTPPPAPPVPVVQPPRPVAPPPPRVVVSTPLPPPTPECQIIEAKLRDAQAAVVQTQAELDAANQAAIKAVQASPDYVVGKVDAASKKSDAQVLLKKLLADEDKMVETDDEKQAVSAAQTDWLAAESKLSQMQSDALANDPGVARAQLALKHANADVTKLQDALDQWIENYIAEADDPNDCPVRAVAFDPPTGTVSVDLNQPTQQAGGTGVAISTIGHLLAASLRNAPYDWDSAVFTVYFSHHSVGGADDAVEFQATYSRPQIQEAGFALNPSYPNDSAVVNLAREFWISPVIAGSQANDAAFNSNDPAEGGAGDGDAVGTEYLGGVWYDVVVIGGYRTHDGRWIPRQVIRRAIRDEEARKAKERASETAIANMGPPRQSASQVQARRPIQSAQRTSTPTRAVKTPPPAPPPSR